MRGTGRRGKRPAVSKRVVKSKARNGETKIADSKETAEVEEADGSEVVEDEVTALGNEESDNELDEESSLKTDEAEDGGAESETVGEDTEQRQQDNSEGEDEKTEEVTGTDRSVEDDETIDLTEENDVEEAENNGYDKEEVTVDVEMGDVGMSQEDVVHQPPLPPESSIELDVDQGRPPPPPEEEEVDHRTDMETEQVETLEPKQQAESVGALSSENIPEVTDETSELEPEFVASKLESGTDARVETRSDTSTPVKDEAFAEEEPQTPTPKTSPSAETKPRQHDEDDNRPYPASLAKLRQLTVNIGPIRQQDLKSDKLHDILKINDVFEIKFELRDKNVEGHTVKEKLGFVRIPFEITTPAFLVRVAYMLGNLHIDGRDMSVRFPDAFNRALDECKKYEEETRKLRAGKLEKKKRQILVKNVPANVTEETIRSLFPEAQLITLNTEETSEGSKKVLDVLLDFDTEEACIQCLDTNKDVFIEDCQLKLIRLFSEKKYPRTQFNYVRRSAFGVRPTRGRGVPIRGNLQAMKIRARALGLRGVNRGRGSARGVGRGVSGRIRGLPERKGLGMSSGRGSMSKTYGKSMGPPSSPREQATLQRRQTSFSRRGNYLSSGSLSREGQFAHANRQETRGRRPYRGRGFSRGKRERPSQYRREHMHSPPFHETHRRESPRSAGHREERYSPSRSAHGSRRSASREEDPVAMMNYLKTTLARMEEKITRRSRSRERYEEHPRSQYRGRGRGSPNRGRGGGRGARGSIARKRPSDTRDYDQPPKRPFMDDSRRDSREGFYGSRSPSMNTGAQRDSFGSRGAQSQPHRESFVSRERGGGQFQRESVGSDRGGMSQSHRESFGNRGAVSHAGRESYGNSRGGASQPRRDSFGTPRGGASQYRRESFGSSKGAASHQADYRQGRETESPRQRSYGDSSVDRNRRDSFSPRNEGYHSGQFGGRGGGSGGRGGSSRGRGFSRGGQFQGNRW